ncbi:MAG TPA: hypothetical protein VML75_12055 [Kofleriaceae bacterium]|nr:hypothetical protein [Kofleriaceae bacterium]
MAKLTMSNWQSVTITNLENSGEKVHALFNPKEIALAKKVPWNKVKGDKSDSPAVEFTNAEPETLTLELFFDTYESKADVYNDHIVSLRALCLVPTGAEGEAKHPPRVLITWGDKAFLKFEGVITSLNVKYTMFLPDGTPVRATANISVQASKRATAKVKKPKTNQGGGGDGPAA